jgi:repressor LexA
MIGAGIFDGDCVVVSQQDTAETGDLVVAGIPDEEATVKTYRRRGRRVALVPANPDYEEIVLDPNAVTIYGKVVTVIRRIAS